MIKQIINIFTSLDKTTIKIMKNGIIICSIFAILSCALLLTYLLVNKSLNLYYIGLSILKLSISFIIDFIICGIVVENIKKQVI